MKSQYQLILIACCAVLLVTSGCGKKQVETKIELPTVEVVQPVRQDLDSLYQATGDLEALQTVELSSEVTGKIKKLYVDEGSRVHKGMVVAEIDDSVQKTQLAQAEANLMKAKAEWEKTKIGARPQELSTAEQTLFEAQSNYDLAQLDYTRVKNMFTQGVASRQELDSSETSLKVKKAALERAQQNLSLVKEGARKEDRASVQAAYEEMKAVVDYYRVQLSKCRIVSPIDGVVTARYKQAGNMVSGQQIAPIIKIENINPIKAVLKIPQEDQFRIKKGMKISMTLDNGTKVDGTVSLVSPAVDESSRAVKIEAMIANKDSVLRPGLFVESNILLETRKNTLTIPQDAVLRQSGDSTQHVFVVSNGVAKKVPVTLGVVNSHTVEVLNGVKDGDFVVISGIEKISDGDKVQISQGKGTK
jgi:multidrug efflux pump subunit AcrA (membrane-fusion protein)